MAHQQQDPLAWDAGDSGPLHVSILFVDLISSTDLASVMGLEEFADFKKSFHLTCQRQCAHFFETFRGPRYEHDGRHYSVNLTGDELVVFLHTDKPHDDVYQLTCLAIALKCAWLSAPINANRIGTGRSTFELAAGIHSGPVWATRVADGFDFSGYAIHLTKRIESISREGEKFRIFLSDPALKLINRRMRNLIFGPRRLVDLKGIIFPMGVYELVESFVNPTRRLIPECSKAFTEVAWNALSTNSFDLWIHSCLQVMEGARNPSISDEALALCRQVLGIDPQNAVALFYQAGALKERGDLDTARLCFEDLLRYWPRFGDGWLALARLLKEIGEVEESRQCVLQARRHGVKEDEESLPTI